MRWGLRPKSSGTLSWLLILEVDGEFTEQILGKLLLGS